MHCPLPHHPPKHVAQAYLKAIVDDANDRTDDVLGSYQVFYFERVDFNHFPLLLSSKGRGGKRLVVNMRNGFGPCLPAGAKAQ